MKKKVTILINENLYGSFKNFCEKDEITVSDKVEILLANCLRKEGVNIKEYPTLNTMFDRINNGEHVFPEPDPIFIEPKPLFHSKQMINRFESVRPAGQDTPVRSFDSVVKSVIQSKEVMHVQINPKQIINRKPVPTIDQLRARRGF